MVKIIGITGKKYNGKDTLGNILIEKYEYKRLAYADNLKEACRHIFGFTDEQLYGNLKEIPDKFWGISPRILLQYIGTNLMRDQLGKEFQNIGEDIWIKSVEKQIKDNNNEKIVITDVRFLNEVESIKKLGGIIIKIERPSINNSINDTHTSESYIDEIPYDYKIINDKDINHLENEIKNIIYIL